MKGGAKKIWVYLSFLRMVLHLLVYSFHRNRSVIDKDLNVWIEQYQLAFGRLGNLVYLLLWHKEFRNLFYYRVKPYDYLLQVIFPRLSSLYINAAYIGPGFFIQHGNGSRINGEYIGANCWVNQQVNIVYSNRTDRPIIKDGVKIHVGASVIGRVTLGENAIIGAGAVIVKDVPANCTVVGVYPAYIVRENGQRVKKIL